MITETSLESQEKDISFSYAELRYYIFNVKTRTNVVQISPETVNYIISNDNINTLLDRGSVKVNNVVYTAKKV